MACNGYAGIDHVLERARTDLARPSAASETGLRLASRIARAGVELAEIQQLNLSLPSELEHLWGSCRTAILFVDVDYDQWGLEILDPWGAIKTTRQMVVERPLDLTASDLVIGLFHGDSDFLILRCDPAANDFGEVIVGLPLDDRRNWYITGLCLSEFLMRFVKARGRKFWEVTSETI